VKTPLDYFNVTIPSELTITLTKPSHSDTVRVHELCNTLFIGTWDYTSDDTAWYFDFSFNAMLDIAVIVESGSQSFQDNWT
jgi:hypothetical protein